MEYVDIKNGYTKKEIKKISEIIKLGGIAILPTDTVYGIVADAENENAVKKIYEIKKREPANPVNILVSNKNMIKQVTKQITHNEEKIIDNFFPGALTIIFEKNEKISQTITANKNTVGIRMPDNKMLLDLITYIGKPIVATSCNMANKPVLQDMQEIQREFKDKVECIVDGGNNINGTPSTIIQIEKNELKVLRKGPISKQELERRIKA